jgi:hypothetical protein
MPTRSMKPIQYRAPQIGNHLPMICDDVALASETSHSLSRPTTKFDSYRSAETPTPTNSAHKKTSIRELRSLPVTTS